MPDVTYTDSGDMISTYADGTTAVFNNGDISWIMASAALVMIMSPGVGLFYSGILRRKNALSMIWISLAIYSLAAFQWFFWGYSLAFGTGSAFIGDLTHFGLINVLDAPSEGSSRIPALLFCLYQMTFACITPVLCFGATAERGRLGPVLVLAFCWMTIVYNPIAHWTWSPSGWLFILGDLDYAGGGPVHMSSGFGALAYSLWLGRRRGYGTERLAYRPSSIANCFLGTTLLWFGWFGFNGGSALSANLRAVQSLLATNVAAATGALTWMLLDYRLERKWSTIALCSGAVAGLVGITPAAGYVGTPASMAIGVVTAVCCNFATKLKYLLKVDDALDVWALHGIGGFTGAVLTGLFADSRVTGFDGVTEIAGGWINKNYIQLGYQLAGATSVSAYAFVVTLILCVGIDFIPFLGLRATEDAEIIGVDVAEMGEVSYDYVHHRREAEGSYAHDPALHDKTTSRDSDKDDHVVSEKRSPVPVESSNGEVV